MESELIRFLLTKWSSNCSVIGNLQQFIGFDDKCIRIHSNGTCELVTELECSHEEADTRMLLNAAHATKSAENIIIHTPDTDVLLIAIAISAQISGNLFIRTGTKNKVRFISIEKFRNASSLRYDLPTTITELLQINANLFHAFTDWDTCIRPMFRENASNRKRLAV